MPKYKYIGQATFVSFLKGIKVEPGEEFETKYILDDYSDFIRVGDSPAPYSDRTLIFTLQPGDKITITKDMFNGMNTLTAYKVGDGDDKNSSIAYLYIDQESDETKNIIDNMSTVIIKRINCRNITRFILKADENNKAEIKVEVSFGCSEL